MKRLLIMGFGLRATSDLTLATLQCLREADTVFVLPLCPEDLRELASLGVNARDLSPLYDSYGTFAERRNRIVGEVMASVEQDRLTAFLAYGHPLVLNGFSEGLIRACESLDGSEVQVLPAISFFDRLCAGMKTPIDANGIVIAEARTALEQGLSLDRRVPVLFGQVALAMDTVDRTSAFEQYLGKYFSPEHLCTFCEWDRRSDRVERYVTPIRAIGIAQPYLSLATSLFVPAMR